MKNIEVEIRSFVHVEKFKELLAFFKTEGSFNNEDFQETIYFDCPQDFRIQKNNTYAKLWYKAGELHDEQREEIKIKFAKEDFENCLLMLKKLNFNEDIKWHRTRYTFDWQDIKVMLDHTKGYGYIVELEKAITENQENALKDLKTKLSLLNVTQTPKQKFDNKFKYYKAHWRTLIADHDATA